MHDSLRRSLRGAPRLALTGAALLLPLGLLFARGSGILSNEFGAPANVTTSYPSCGQCHDPFPNSRGAVDFDIQTTRSFAAGSSVPVTVQLLGGVPGSTRGGFSMLSDAGAFTSGSTTRVSNDGKGITHTSSLQRSWSFSFASSQPGLHQWTAVGNTVNGDGRTSGDSWGFYGEDPNVPGEAFRVFVNDPSVQAFGSSCDGQAGYQALIGIEKPAALGQSLQFDLYDVPPRVASLGVLSFSRTSYGPLPLPFDLSPLGAPGCSLYVSLDFFQAKITGGLIGAGAGSASFSWPLPSDPNLRGLDLYVQALTLDARANAFGMTTSHALQTKTQ
jgi:hypothetical protein